MRKTKSVIIGILLIASILTIVNPVSAATLEVGPGKTYTTIQAAIDSANPGDTILVYPGTYNEYVNINVPNITLRSAGGRDVTIIGPGTETRVLNIAENLGTIVVEGFTITLREDLSNPDGIIQGSLSGTGTACHILNNKVVAKDNLRNAIQVSGDNSKVIGNIVIGAPLASPWASTGIGVVGAKNVLVKDNYVTGSNVGIALTDYSGLWAIPTPADIIIETNILEKNNVGILLYGIVEKTLIINNTIKNNNYGIREDHWPNFGSGGPKNTVAHYNEICHNEIEIGVRGVNAPFAEEHILDARFNNWCSCSGPNRNNLIGPIGYLPFERTCNLPMDQISRIMGIGTRTGPVGELIEDANVSQEDPR